MLRVITLTTGLLNEAQASILFRGSSRRSEGTCVLEYGEESSADKSTSDILGEKLSRCQAE